MVYPAGNEGLASFPILLAESLASTFSVTPVTLTVKCLGEKKEERQESELNFVRC